MEQMVGVSFVQVLDDGEFAVGGQAVGLSGPRASYRRAHDLRSHNPAAFGGVGSASFADGGTVGGNAGVREVRFPAPAAACRADRRQSGFAVEVLKVSAPDRVQQRHPHLLALRMRRLKWFFALFPEFKKVRSPAASAEIIWQVEFPRWALIKWLVPESPRTRAHGRRRLLSWRSPRCRRRRTLGRYITSRATGVFTK